MFGERHDYLRADVPIPSMSLTDRESVYKFLDHAKSFCEEKQIPFEMYINWAIHVLLASLVSDNASRILLPKTDTVPFKVDTLFPFEVVDSHGSQVVDLQGKFIISPAWNNMDIYQAISAIAMNEPEEQPDKHPDGYYIPEMNLAIIAQDPERHLIDHAWRRGHALLWVISVVDMNKAVQIDGKEWVFKQDEHEVRRQILDNRFALAYELQLLKSK